MTLRILDTDHLTLLQRQHPIVVQRISQFNPADIAITVITAEEQLRGRLNTIRQASSMSDLAKLVEAYRLFNETLEDLETLKICYFDQAACSRFVALQREKLRVGAQDLKIAAIARSLNAIVVTRNDRDFSRIPNLQIENWLIA